MISAVLFINLAGDIVIARHYRDDVTRTATDAFRQQVIAAKQTDRPIVHIANSSFLYVRHNDMYVVAVTRQNANPSLIFAFLYKLIELFQAYFGGKFDEPHVRNNFVLMYELLDEAADHGFPQITAVTLLSTYIKMANAPAVAVEDQRSDNQITSEITGAVDWRQAGVFRYKENEVYIDVLEAVNVLISASGELLKSDVSGRVMMKTYLSGMPDCRFGMNDRVLLDKRHGKGGRGGGRRGSAGGKGQDASKFIAIDDLTFHRCVRLSQFEADRSVNFTPPDGEFELMKYRITKNVNLPFKVTPVVSEHTSRIEYDVKITANFDKHLVAEHLVVRIPTPNNAAKAKLTCTSGRTKYKPEQRCILWRIRTFPGQRSYRLQGECRLMHTSTEKQWSRPPMTLTFDLPMFTASGLDVRYLKVIEREGYQTKKWVRYVTKAGHYQIRI